MPRWRKEQDPRDWRLDPYNHDWNSPGKGSPITWVMVVGLVIIVGLFAVQALTDDSIDHPTDEERIRRTLFGFYADLAAGDSAEACAVLDVRAKNRLTDASPLRGDVSCAEVLAADRSAFPDGAGRPLENRFPEIEVDGSTATAKNAGTGTTIDLIELDGTWLIDRGVEVG